MKTTVITCAALTVDLFNLKEAAESWKNEWFGHFLPGSLVMHFSCLGGIVGRETLDRIGRLQTHTLRSVEGFPMYAHYEHASAYLPRESTDSLMCMNWDIVEVVYPVKHMYDHIKCDILTDSFSPIMDMVSVGQVFYCCCLSFWQLIMCF